jgi:ubiquinone/menaquinone biosynthesis C-methylase UbiE/GT2 family glycosyltransferase
MKQSVEVIIPTLNRPECVANLLNSLLKQTYKPNKITIIDAGNISVNYSYYENIFKQTGIRFYNFNTKPGLTHQRNFAIKKIDCDLVLFSDDDVILESDYLEKIIQIFENDISKEIGGATGKLMNFKNKIGRLSLVFRKIFFLGIVSDGSISTSGFSNSINYETQSKSFIKWLSGCNMIFRKEVFDYNLFDENLEKYAYMEDLDFSFRVSKNFKLVYIPEAGYSHFPSLLSRLGDASRYTMLMRNHHYLFKKNFSDTIKNRIPHYLSLIGIPLQALLLKRSYRGFFGAIKGLIEIIFTTNHNLPNYLERLDYSNPSRIQIAEHEVRYNYAASFCEDKVVLDCALGEGIGANILCQKAKKVIGVDLDKNAIEAAKKNIQYDNIEFVCASAINLPFDDNTFDVITSMETLEHIPEKYHCDLINEFKRVLKPGGKFILSTPNKSRTSPNKIAPSNYFHLREVTYKELKELFSKYFQNVTYVGLYNPLREGSIESIKQKMEYQNLSISPPKKSIQKKLMLFMPFWLKDFLSIILKGIHIYPSVSEYQLIENDVEFTNDLIFIGIK